MLTTSPPPAVRASRPHRPLIAVTVVMVVLVLAGIGGALIDDRELLGHPIWMKPLKFMISFALYTGTLAWMLSLQTKARRLGWWVGTIVAVGLAVEIAIIIGQVVVRGRLLHFNMSTPTDQLMHNLLATTIYLVWAAVLVLAIVLLFDKPGDRALRWSVRLALLTTLGGMLLGNLMFRPTPGQSRVEAETGEMPHMGAHSVGREDGAGGMPIMGWNTDSGDLRIGHFLGIHSLQVIPLIALALVVLAKRCPRLRPEGTRAALVFVGAAAWLGLIWLTTWQALRGEALIHPTTPTLLAAGALAGGTALATTAVLLVGKRAGQP
ncbi:hypothetical protein [Kribbella deserti]|uniref:Uncharacterized protein n=1 Tax=Kribbella deserti TaxID=1926257 RepID=A0ABV6QKM7_9ACTN